MNGRKCDRIGAWRNALVARPRRWRLAVADHEATLVHRSPEQRGGVASGGVAKLTPDQASWEARGDAFAEAKGLPWKVAILTTSGRITKLRLVRPGSLVSNEIAFLAVSSGSGVHRSVQVARTSS